MSDPTPPTATPAHTVTLPISDEFCKTILTCCYEGGSSYWLACEQVVYSDPKKDDYGVEKIIGCRDVEDRDTKWGEVGFATIRLGVQRIAHPEFKIGTHLRKEMLALLTDKDDVTWDAWTADAVLQAGLLGELVYG